MDRAKLDSSLSEVGLTAGEFFSTINNIVFKTPVEIVETVLKSEGYTVNLENILAGLEQFTIGIVASNVEEKNLDKPIVKKYNHSIQFKLPSKSSRGLLLNLFYKEIEIYDSLLSKEGKLAEKNELKSEMEGLKEENMKLKKEIGNLYKKLGNAGGVSEHEITKLIDNIPLSINDIRPAKVSEISLDKRDIELKIGKKSFHFPLIRCAGIPSVGDDCLAYTENGVIKDLFFYNSPMTPFTIIVGKTVWKEKNCLKVRGDDRKEWIIEAKNDDELEQISKFRRNDSIILEFANKTIIRFKKTLKPIKDNLRSKIYAEFLAKEISDQKKLEAKN